jgi:hypothetical protein
VLSHCINLQAQDVNDKDVVGNYKISDNDPSSSQSLILLENHKYVFIYFGGMIRGDWSVKGNKVYFKGHAEPEFAIYGRQLQKLKDTVQIRCNVERDQQAMINYTDSTSNYMNPIFNKDGNCFNYPNIIQQTTPISFVKCTMPFDPSKEIMSDDYFDVSYFKIPKKYNDIILINLPIEYLRARNFEAVFDNGILYTEGSTKGIRKTLLTRMNKEDLNAIIRLSENSILQETLEYGNEFFPSLDDSSDNNEARTSFQIITKHSIQKRQKIEVAKKSIFISYCD